jgi:protein-disulfide isomerase
VLGSPDAPVTVVEYADLQCPFCAEWARRAFGEIVRDYVAPGRVRIEFRGLVFLGPDSEVALRTALAAGRQDRLWDVVHLLYANQGAENAGWVTQDLLEGSPPRFRA